MPLFPLHVLLFDVPAVIDALQGASEGLLPLPGIGAQERARRQMDFPALGYWFVLELLDEQPRLGVVEVAGDPAQ
ncbi:hypothetical protein D3C79_1059380 [compost metagenome]